MITYVGAASDQRSRDNARWGARECDQGLFLLHVLDNGFTAIQWWDRNQGDTRGACNSTILLEGVHTSAEMVLAAGKATFPHVFENLAKAKIELREVTIG